MSTHACPLGEAATTPCCQRSPHEISSADQITMHPSLVACTNAGNTHRGRLALLLLEYLLEHPCCVRAGHSPVLAEAVAEFLVEAGEPS